MTDDKERLDKLIVQRGMVNTRSRAAAMIMAGSVQVDGRVATKAGMQVQVDVVIEIEEPLAYVSRGGYKLARAMDVFSIRVDGEICADVGACTGGFTDVLLQRGAAKVYAIDVGYGHLAWKLRQDSRVVVLEKTNARHLDSLPDEIDFACVDVSFISLRLVLPAVEKWLSADGQVVALIKPQFEAGPKYVPKGGVVRDSSVHRRVIRKTLEDVGDLALFPAGLIPSPLRGSAGNIEFLLWLKRENETAFETESAIASAVTEANAKVN